MPARKVYFTAEQEEQLRDLRIENLSEWIREKMKEDLARRTPLTSLSDEISRRRAELDELQVAFNARAVDQERALAIVEAAAVSVRRNLAYVPPANVQTSILRWVRGNPGGRRVREILPASLSDQDVVEILERWPESKDDVVKLLEVKT